MLTRQRPKAMDLHPSLQSWWRCVMVLLWVLQDITGGEEPFGRHQRIRPLLHSLWVYMFYLFPSSLLRFLLCPSERRTLPANWNPLLQVPSHTCWQWKGIYHGMRTLEENALTVPLGWAFEVKDGIPSPTKAPGSSQPWGHLFPMGPSVPSEQHPRRVCLSRLAGWSLAGSASKQ